MANFGLSPPEHLAPKGLGHQFSYTPPDRDRPPSDSESDAAESESEASIHSKGKAAAPSSGQDSDLRGRQPSVIRPVDEDTDFTVEELSDDDIGHDDLPVIRPDQTEDARSNDGSKVSERDIIEALNKLRCGAEEEQEKAQQFETAQRESYQRRKKRWSIGGYKKRSHAQSVGSQSSGHEDVEPLDDIHLPGASARRLRRRTYEPEDGVRPSRTSLLFEDPPRELEELAVYDDPPPLLSDTDADRWSDDDDDDDDDDSVEEIELLLPTWLMEIESNPSRPSTAGSLASAPGIRPSTPAPIPAREGILQQNA
jgi:hypothetical protein